jgi:hypothetical protein
MFIHLNGLRQLTLFFVEAGVLLLFLAQLAGGFEEGLEVILVALIFEKVDLGEELLFLLFELGNLFLELVRVHGVRAETLDVLVDGAELGLQVAVQINGVAHVFICSELVGDGEGHEELGGVGFALEVD